MPVRYATGRKINVLRYLLRAFFRGVFSRITLAFGMYYLSLWYVLPLPLACITFGF